jgi:hypothetical protein
LQLAPWLPDQGFCCGERLPSQSWKTNMDMTSRESRQLEEPCSSWCTSLIVNTGL